MESPGIWKGLVELDGAQVHLVVVEISDVGRKSKIQKYRNLLITLADDDAKQWWLSYPLHLIIIIKVDDCEGNIDEDATPFGRLLSSISVGSFTESLKLLLNFIVLMLRAAMITLEEEENMIL